MQHRTSSPCTQSGASVEFRVVILVLSKHFFVFSARVSLKQRAIKTRTPTRHRRIITPRSGLGTFSARLVFWKAEIKARTPVPLPGTCGSRRARPVRIFHGAFHTTVSTGTCGVICVAMTAPRPRGGPLVTTDQAPHRARSMRRRSSRIFNGVTRNCHTIPVRASYFNQVRANLC
jgi:hypothetical protein